MDGENVELVLSIHALTVVSRFLRYRAPSRVVDLLKAGLSQVFEGASPPMFRGRKDSGRPSEVSVIHQVKGVLAGLMQVKQKSGMQRATAATWVARNIAPELASRLSVKQITSRAVLEWLDRYGGKHPPDDPGGKAFKVWSTPLPKPLTVQKFKEITARIAELIPARRLTRRLSTGSSRIAGRSANWRTGPFSGCWRGPGTCAPTAFPDGRPCASPCRRRNHELMLPGRTSRMGFAATSIATSKASLACGARATANGSGRSNNRPSGRDKRNCKLPRAWRSKPACRSRIWLHYQLS